MHDVAKHISRTDTESYFDILSVYKIYSKVWWYHVWYQVCYITFWRVIRLLICLVH